MTTRRLATLVVGGALAAAALVGGRRRPPPLTGEEPRPAPTEAGLADEAPLALAPPTRAELRLALARAFSRCVETPAETVESAIGDFNGDGWLDVVVVVQPSEERAHEINDPFRNWVVLDLARDPPRLGPVRATRVEKGERLLAVIHGHGPEGWRSPEARQAYLLKNAGGGRVAFLRSDELPPTSHPPLRGGVIALEAEPVKRFLYWTGARYASWP